MRIVPVLACAAVLTAAWPAAAGTISGVVTDATGAALVDARVIVRDIATGRETTAATDAEGRYRIATPGAGTYLVIVSRPGFSDAARTVVVENPEHEVEMPVQLELGVMSAQVTVTAARAEREVRQIPLHVESTARAAIQSQNPLSTGDVLAAAPNVTPVGSGPFLVRPRLRGLDSTRLLVLVDGERLNTARQATERTGAEVGLVSADAIERVEIVNGAGTLMYGSDALAGTINIITNEPGLSPTPQLLYGFTGYYSSNENGRRGTLTLGATTSRFTFRAQGGVERYDNYRAGKLTVEDTRPYFASGRLRRADTVDDGFGFSFRAFPDPFNAPYVRTSSEVPNSQAAGAFVNLSSLITLGERRTLRVKYQRRRMTDVGYADFAAPYFFNVTSVPHSNLDKVSARYEAQAVRPWLAKLSLTTYYQQIDRLLQTTLPVQFPAPSGGTFFPITVFRLDILSKTGQRVWTPGVDLQAVLVPAPNHLLTAGVTAYRDRSSDTRTTETTTSMVGQVAVGARGPAPIVFPSPVALGPPAIAHPVRVPDASLRDVALFAADEWRLRPTLAVTAGLRGDFYTVTTEATPGYDVAAVAAGATPAIDPSTLPNPAGATYARRALTGDIGLLANPDGRVHPFVRFGRSYRHPNLEEMLFAGPATIGSIVPNVKVKPETGRNFDAGAKFRAGRVDGGVYYFLNQYQNFIGQDLVVARTASGPLAQATNYADVRITGLEFSVDAPVVFRRGVLTLTAQGAFTRGTITRGVNPLDGSSLAGTPFDNITPARVIAAARFTDASSRWWMEYGVRRQSEVARVARTLLDSPFLIAQDLLSLKGFAVQRVGWGVNVGRGRERAALVFAVENLADAYYREQFQFAPARGRSFTVGINIGGF